MTPLEIIAIAETVLKAGGTIIDYIRKLRETLKQNGELSPEEEARLDALIASTTSQSHWKPQDPTP